MKFFNITSFLSRKSLNQLILMLNEITHELNTTFAIIRSGLMGGKEEFQNLLETYELAKTQGLKVPNIYQHRIESLRQFFNNTEMEIKCANHSLKMLTLNVSAEFGSYNDTISVKHILEKALESLPKRRLIKCSLNFISEFQDFNILSNEALMLNFFHNLLEFSINRAFEDHLQIILATKILPTKAILRYKDRGKKIESKILKRIFKDVDLGAGDRMFGMIFCKKIINSLGGKIECYSTDCYTEFTMEFPISKKAKNNNEVSN